MCRDDREFFSPCETAGDSGFVTQRQKALGSKGSWVGQQCCTVQPAPAAAPLPSECGSRGGPCSPTSVAGRASLVWQTVRSAAVDLRVLAGRCNHIKLSTLTQRFVDEHCAFHCFILLQAFTPLLMRVRKVAIPFPPVGAPLGVNMLSCASGQPCIQT